MIKESREKNRLLIADDSKMNREILKEILGDEYIVTEAKDGTEAIELLKKEEDSFSALLLDLNMPETNGYQVLEWMNEEYVIERIPVIVILAEDNHESIEKAYELGAMDYFTHPFDMFEIQKRVAGTLNLYKKYENLIMASKQVIYVCNSDYSRILYASDGFCRKFNVERNNLYGKNFNSDSGIVLDPEANKDENIFGIKLKFDKRTKNYYQFSVEKTMWGCRNANIVTLLDVTKLIKLNQERVMVFKKSARFLSNLNDNVKTILHLNLSENTFSYIDNNYNELIEKEKYKTVDEIMEALEDYMIVPEEREQFHNKFNKQKLIDSYVEDDENQSFVCACVLEERYRFVLKMTLALYKNVINGEIEGFFIIEDITDAKMDRMTLDLFYSKNYVITGIADLVNNSIYVKRENDNETSKLKNRYRDYDQFCKNMADIYIDEKTKSEFYNMLSKDAIMQKLEKDEQYFETIEYKIGNNIKIAKIQFRWFIKEYKCVLITVEDTTNESHMDILTGLYNRSGFHNKAKDIIEKAEDVTKYAMMYFNLKSFKAINHSVGTEGGDYILKNYASRLKNSELEPLTLGRTQSDHFGCLVERRNINWKKLIEFCTQDFEYKGMDIKIQSLVGIYYIEDKNIGINEMYDSAKMSSENIEDGYVKPYKIFDNSIRKQYISSNMVVRNFETAMKKGEFEVYLQPVFDAKTRKMASAEALIRWKYQGDKLISPAVFIPALEDSGQISLLDLFVIKTVKNYQERRRKSGKTNIPISMNLSWMDFYDKKMIDWILDDLQQNPTPQNVVRYEITETSYAAIAENRQNVLDEFKSRNAKIMLDDFGSGYSSFSMLQSYDFDILKLDMGFVRKIESSEKTREIIKSIIGMAHRIGAKIVAEGAETDQQVEFFKENDCDYIQGYYFSKPLPQKEFEAYVEEYWDNDKVFEK